MLQKLRSNRSVLSVGPIGRTDGNLDLDRTNRSQRSRWTGPIGPGNTPGPSRTDKIGSTRLGPKSVGLGRSRSGPDRGCPYLPCRQLQYYKTTSTKVNIIPSASYMTQPADK